MSRVWGPRHAGRRPTSRLSYSVLHTCPPPFDGALRVWGPGPTRRRGPSAGWALGLELSRRVGPQARRPPRSALAYPGALVAPHGWNYRRRRSRGTFSLAYPGALVAPHGGAGGPCGPACITMYDDLAVPRECAGSGPVSSHPCPAPAGGCTGCQPDRAGGVGLLTHCRSSRSRPTAGPLRALVARCGPPG